MNRNILKQRSNKKIKRGLKEKKEICCNRKKKGKTGMDAKDRNKDEDRK